MLVKYTFLPLLSLKYGLSKSFLINDWIIKWALFKFLKYIKLKGYLIICSDNIPPVSYPTYPFDAPIRLDNELASK